MPNQYEGAFSVSIQWSPLAEQTFQQIWRVWKDMDNFTEMWKTVADIISRGIMEQIVFGITPDNEFWWPLSPMYAKRAGRSRMIIPETSPIWNAYVTHPRLEIGKKQLVYSAGGKPEIYHLALRLGWQTRGGIRAPAREWFGISRETSTLIDQCMSDFIAARLERLKR